ncbi:hypothetical protein [Corallococcus llansteffanensis]|uniref:Uncharacterized protein n=1 Tax=Corallococcus llansteffanensis TaxID=2316731 RepID=A0A3A8PPX0_9BACT|nr:hypothetical protein [Corallococcus llansteffanensis]RKH56801.1 hypothetical protein D7V93_19590 [Corallococcus llansteffanensis]
MLHHSTRGLLGLVPSWLRSLTLSSLALGGLMLSTSARAQEAEPAATLVDLAMEDGTLTARIQWSAQGTGLPSYALLTSYDGKESATAQTRVVPKAGTVSVVKLFGALQEPWTTGWAQTLVLADEQGQSLVTQPYDVNLDCSTGETCGFVVAPGLASTPDTVHLSSELDAALTAVEAKYGTQDVDLVEQVSKDFPVLRGEALVYAHQLAQIPPLMGPCTCVWQAVHTRSPSGLGYGINSSSAAGVLSGWNGAGAKHWLTAIGLNATGITASVTGYSESRLQLSCKRWSYIFTRSVPVFTPGGVVKPLPFPFPIYRPCISNCQVRFDHRGRISGRTFSTYEAPYSTATATEQSTYRRDSTILLNLSATQGGAFDQTWNSAVMSNVGSTGRVNTTGYVQSKKPSTLYGSSASVSNGYAIMIHAKAACPYVPTTHVGVWNYGTSQGTPQTTSLQQTIKSFFLQWGLVVNP